MKQKKSRNYAVIWQDNKWKVKRVGSHRATAVFLNRENAVIRARIEATRTGGSVYILDTKGRVSRILSPEKAKYKRITRKVI